MLTSRALIQLVSWSVRFCFCPRFRLLSTILLRVSLVTVTKNSRLDYLCVSMVNWSCRCVLLKATENRRQYIASSSCEPASDAFGVSQARVNQIH